MADRSKIEWTDATWNPIRARLTRDTGARKAGTVGWHCERITTGCGTPKEGGCYAEALNWRLGTGLPFKPGHLDDGTVELFLDDNILRQPLRWKRPRMVFPCSMTDLFGRFVKDEWLDKIFAVMALTPQHTYQPLTKRSDRMRAYLSRHRWHHWAEAGRSIDAKRWRSLPDVMGGDCTPLPNVWLGVSTERQEEANARIPDLLATPAAVRFISAEPLLGPIDLHEVIPDPLIYNAVHGMDRLLDWVIVGGESGRNARPMHPDWARSLRDHCQAAGVPYFFKQWGEWLPWAQFNAAKIDDDPEQTKYLTSEWVGDHWHRIGYPQWCDAADGNIDDDQCVGRVGKKAAGRLLDGIEHNAMPQLTRILP